MLSNEPCSDSLKPMSAAAFSLVSKCGSVCNLLAIRPALIALSLENSVVSFIH